MPGFDWFLIKTLAFASVLPAPGTLSQTGLYEDAQTGTVASSNRGFEPQYALWSDGAVKRRWVFLPTDEQIDTSDRNAWKFPVGTKIWKEFSLPDAETSRLRKIETRYLEKTASGWIYATYLWNEAGTEAALAPEAGIDDYYRLPGNHSYRVPSTYECMSCHSGGKDPIIGFSALQLSPVRDSPPSDPAVLDLEKLADEGRFTHSFPAAPAIPSTSAKERGAIGYLHGNCASCHRKGGAAAFSGMHLDVNVNEPLLSKQNVFKTAVGQATNFLVPGHEDTGQRIRPGSPEESSVFYRLKSETPGEIMPLFGRSTHDAPALDLLREWIAGLTP